MNAPMSLDQMAEARARALKDAKAPARSRWETRTMAVLKSLGTHMDPIRRIPVVRYYQEANPGKVFEMPAARFLDGRYKRITKPPLGGVEV